MNYLEYRWNKSISVCPQACTTSFKIVIILGMHHSSVPFLQNQPHSVIFFSIFFEILFCHYLAKWVSLFSFLSHHYLASSESPQCFASIFGRIFPFPDWLIISKSKIDFSSKTTQQYLFMQFLLNLFSTSRCYQKWLNRNQLSQKYFFPTGPSFRPFES